MDEGTLVSVDEAIRELEKHGFYAEAVDGVDGVILANQEGCNAPLSPDTMDRVCDIDKDGNVRSLDVLAWLGY